MVYDWSLMIGKRLSVLRRMVNHAFRVVCIFTRIKTIAGNLVWCIGMTHQTYTLNELHVIYSKHNTTLRVH